MKPISVTNTIGAINLRNNLCCFVESKTGPATADRNHTLVVELVTYLNYLQHPKVPAKKATAFI